jgi:hypothetical protein
MSFNIMPASSGAGRSSFISREDVKARPQNQAAILRVENTYYI